MKKFLTILLAVAFVFGMAMPAMANPGQNPNQNPGSPELASEGITITVTGGGNNLVIRAICNATGAVEIIPRAGNGTFTQTFIVFGYDVTIQVRGNSLVSATSTRIHVCVPTCDLNCDKCEPCEGYCADCDDPCGCACKCEPIVVNLGFIGHYMHNGRVLTTSFYWQTLNEGDMIDWDAVDAAYADWYARGGLRRDESNGWRTSGFAPIFFCRDNSIGHGDLGFPQLEGFYRAYFVATGYVLPIITPEVIAYYALCQLYNDLMWGNDGFGLTARYTLTAEERAALHNTVGLPHRDALQDWWGIPRGEQDVRYIPVSRHANYFFEYWSDRIREGLEPVAARLGICIDTFIANYDTAGFLTRNNLWGDYQP